MSAAAGPAGRGLNRPAPARVGISAAAPCSPVGRRRPPGYANRPDFPDPTPPPPMPLPFIAPPLAQGGEGGRLLLIGGLLLALLLGLVFVAIMARYIGLWVQCKLTGTRIGLFDLVMMSVRKVNPTVITRSLIMATQAGVVREYGLTRKQLEAHYLANGNVPNVIKSLIAARRANLSMDWNIAAAIDLAGRNVLEAVQTSVDPKVIDCPDPRRHGRNSLDGVAKDGIQLKARARVTVRTNIQQLVGGATEETVIARVGEGIVSAIGSSATHKVVLADPVLIAKAVLNKGLDSQTAYEIVSIDIADIDVGDNVGARLQADQAEADMRIARAKAEERRAMAVATEQVQRAVTQENQAKVVLAEAEIPLAMAEAFKRGGLRADEDGNVRESKHHEGNGAASPAAIGV